MNHTIETRDPHQVRTRHSLHKAHVPPPDKKSAEWAAFLETVRNDGRIRVAISITKDGQVIDGWWRREAAHDLQLDGIPCEVVDDAEAALLIVETLTARKQMTRGAAVYLALGMLADYATAANARRLKNRAAQRTTGEEQIDSKLPSTGHGASRNLAARWGCAHGTVDQARLVRAHLHDGPTFADWLKKINARPPEGGAAKLQAALRAEFEPLLFNGEKSLWTILQAAGGRLSTADKPKNVQLEMNFGLKLDALFGGDMPKPSAAQAVIEEKLQDNDDIEALERIVKFGQMTADAAQARIAELKKIRAA